MSATKKPVARSPAASKARPKPGLRVVVPEWTTSAAAANWPLLLSMREACGELRVCRVTLYKLLRERRLKSVMLGRRRMILTASLMRLAGGG